MTVERPVILLNANQGNIFRVGKLIGWYERQRNKIIIRGIKIVIFLRSCNNPKIPIISRNNPELPSIRASGSSPKTFLNSNATGLKKRKKRNK
ncbi:hypothetical protein [Fischerella thermalis]|uniref:hypothetical protein n=1 Tax=Fischerella thermalis TaxID=372787 RepID=UPI001CA5C5C3|nr:hypothetical protein [Fischerella thermalis]